MASTRIIHSLYDSSSIISISNDLTHCFNPFKGFDFM